MPFTRIDVDATRTAAEINAISEGVYSSLVEAVHAPLNDKFQIITRHGPGEIVFSRDYLGIDRTDHFVSIQIFFYAGRTIEQKKLLFRTIAEKLAVAPGIRKQDVLVSVIDTAKENWSYGNGEAQFADEAGTGAVMPPLPDAKLDWMAPTGLLLSVVSLLSVLILLKRRTARS